MLPTTNSYRHRMKNDRCLLTFEIISDLHVTLPMYVSSLNRALEDIWTRKTKTLVILGDLSSNGFPFQLKQCLTQLKEYPLRYLIALGNHDTYHRKDPKQVHIHPLYKELVLQGHTHIYYDIYVEGFHFYILNSEQSDASNAYYSTQQLYWLKEHLQQDDQDKPVFVLCHHPMKDTHVHSDEKKLSMGVQQSDLLRIIKTHPHVFFLSGHIHNSYEQCSIRVDETIFELDVPSFRKTQYGNKKEEIGFQIQIYHDFLYLRTRDYKQGDWILSHEFILDYKTHHCFPLDVES